MKKAEKIYRDALNAATKDKDNLEHVYHLLQEAVSLGSYNAMYALGSWYLHGKFVGRNYKKGFLLIQASIPNNKNETFYDLAVCYETGKGIKMNKAKAFEYYLKSALLGNKQSIYEIGRCYYYGNGTNKDHYLASIWLEIAEVFGIS